MISRRQLLPLPLAAGLAAAAPSPGFSPLAEALPAIERASGGTLGLAIRDRATGAQFGWRADSRFPMCSTFKLPLAAQLLDAAHKRRVRLDEQIPIGTDDMVTHAPFTRPRIGQAATLDDLAAAIMVSSDNPASNLILRRLGGPAAHTAWLRAMGDRTTRLDRWETEMSEGPPGDPRDTTTPAAMLRLVEQLLFGRALPPAARQRLIDWMEASETGDAMLRAGLPAGWREGNKTGAGVHGVRNIVSIIHQPGRAPILAAIYLMGAQKEMAARNANYPPIARAIARSIA